MTSFAECGTPRFGLFTSASGRPVSMQSKEASQALDKTWPTGIDIEDEESERRHFHTILSSFKHYRSNALQRLNKTERFMLTFADRHKKYLVKYRESLKKVRWCIEQNDRIVNEIIRDASAIFLNIPSEAIGLPVEARDVDMDESDTKANGNTSKTSPIKPRAEDIEKVQSVLKQLVRDWSSVGEQERQQCYQPIIDVIIKEFPEPSGIRILVPGAGLGRLAYEVAVRGYACEGNEFSLFMLFASNFVLNKCHKVNGNIIYPWAHQYVNNLSCDSQTTEVRFPDADPSALENTEFSMVAGDFLKVYVEPDNWECVCTCFFLDCGPNVILFIETIYNILKPGGIWVNLGPLLYHYSDMPNEDSIEPSFDILRGIIKEVGFTIREYKTGVKTKYAQNPSSMLQYEYDSVFFVCVKPSKIIILEEN